MLLWDCVSEVCVMLIDELMVNLLILVLIFVVVDFSVLWGEWEIFVVGVGLVFFGVDVVEVIVVVLGVYVEELDWGGLMCFIVVDGFVLFLLWVDDDDVVLGILVGVVNVSGDWMYDGVVFFVVGGVCVGDLVLVVIVVFFEGMMSCVVFFGEFFYELVLCDGIMLWF